MLTKKFFTIVLISFLLFSTDSIDLRAQITLEANVGIGATGVDIDDWTYDNAYNWGLFMGTISAAIYPLKFNNISIGAEFNFHHFFWYSVKYSYDYYNVEYDVEVDAFGLMALVRSDITNKLFVDVGIGSYFFSEFKDFGMMASVGYKFELGEKLYIPLKFRAELVFDEDANLFPVGINIGLGYTL